MDENSMGVMDLKQMAKALKIKGNSLFNHFNFYINLPKTLKEGLLFVDFNY